MSKISDINKGFVDAEIISTTQEGLKPAEGLEPIMTASDATRVGLEIKGDELVLDAINMACNDIQLTGHLNVDLDPNNNPQLVYDVTKLDEVVKGTVHHIYAGHIYEHLTHAEGARFLQVCKKLLAPHGVLTIVVPDWRKATDKNMAPTIEDAEGIILGMGQHVRLLDYEVLERELRAIFPEVHMVPVHEVKYCIYPSVPWQTAAICINHPDQTWHYIKRKNDDDYAREWKERNKVGQ